MIQISELNLTLPGGRKLFDDLSWKVDDGARIGLVGPNGVGKTTLLRTLVGQVQADSGRIDFSPAQSAVGYLPQDLTELPDRALMAYLKDRRGLTEAESALQRRTEELASCPPQDRPRWLKLHSEALSRYEALEGYAFEALARKTLKGLGFADGDGERNCRDFSGGWKMRIALAALLLSRPEVMLLDEPTNHLDTESMEWLEGWLASYQGTLIAISHDRLFMDKVMRSIAELHGGKIRLYKGSFSDYLHTKEAQEAQLRQAAARQQAEIAKTKEFIERFRYKATKAAQVQSRVKQLEKTQLIEVESAAKRVHMAFPPCPPSGQVVLRVQGLGKSYGQHRVFGGLEFEIPRGQKVALVGANGAGKSTLSRLIAGREEPSEGRCELGYKVSLAYFSQESSENLDYGRTIWQEINPLNFQMSETEKRGLLGAFLFSGDDIHKPISVLSGGEKSRLSLVKILMKSSNFLVLDEPTNHLDMVTRELFQEALLNYDGTLLVVSHDRFFLNQLAHRVLEIRDGRLYDYAGNYSHFIEQRQRQLESAAAPESPKAAPAPPQSLRDRRRQEGQRRNEIYRKKKPYLEECARLEAQIGELEGRKAQLEEQLCAPEVLAHSGQVQELMKQLASLAPALDDAMERWEEAMAALEAIDRESEKESQE